MKSTLAITAAELAALVLKRRDSDAAHQCFRIKNLHPNEIATLVEAWLDISIRHSLTEVRLLVTSDLGADISPEYVADADKTITYYRNNNPQGLIYIESAVQGDEQGLQNIFSLRDSNFLDGSFDEYADSTLGIPELLIRNAWKLSPKGEQNLPTLLIEHIVAVLNNIHPSIETIPVRKFVAFIERCITEWQSRGPIVDGQTASSLIGVSLDALGMFPDESWNASEAKIQRRLELNLRHAELMDGGTELSTEDIYERVARTIFKDGDGNPLDDQESRRYQYFCKSYGESPSDSSIRAKIPYNIFAQLFSKDTTGLRLGDRVREEIINTAPNRTDELSHLDVVTGINAKSSQDAIRFLDATPPAGLAELKSLLTQGTRKAVERLAAPPKRQFFNPALLIVQLCEAAAEEEDWDQICRVQLEPRGGNINTEYTLGLFNFLFSASLSSVESALRGLPGAIELIVSEEFTAQRPPPPIRDDVEDDDEENPPPELVPLPVRITFSDANGAVITTNDQFEWTPGEEEKRFFAAFWLLTCAYSGGLNSFGLMEIRGDSSYDAWIKRIADREQEVGATLQLKAPDLQSCHQLLIDIGAARSAFLDALPRTGLDVETINQYVDTWQPLLERVSTSVVPQGTRLPDLDRYLNTDFIAMEGVASNRLMTPLHPIKLRWISAYLKQTSALAFDYLSKGASFASGNGDMYLTWFSNISPRENPPIGTGAAGSLLFSKSGIAWWEDYSEQDHGSTNLSYDTHSLGTVVNRIVGYLDAHPYKKDGLSLLVVLPTHDQIPAEIISRISGKATQRVRVSMTVVTPRSRWENTAKHIEQLPDPDEQTSHVRIFPPIDLSFVDSSDGNQYIEEVAGRHFDIGIVTHMLEKSISSQQITEMPLERPGHYDVLRHRPLRLDSEGNGSMSLIMLPEYKDPALESWSTLVVRNHRTKPVSPEQPENIDLIELKVNFQDSAQIFHALHDTCHWVITLERHISRDQLESIEAGSPDILSLETGIGENQDNTIVVSSKSGRRLICAKLQRKLSKILSPSLPAPRLDIIPRLAEDIYESTRHFSPRLALQALGVTRATEELFGLTLARILADSQMPAKPSEGLTLWLSLDDHAKWFGGISAVRADICRVSLDYVEQRLEVRLLVVEGKLRQLFDEHGVEQVRKTKRFFESVFKSSGTGESPHIDSQMWQEELANAIAEAAPSTATHFYGGQSIGSTTSNASDIANRALADIRSGRYVLREVQGFYSICLWESDCPSIAVETQAEVRIVRTYRNHIEEILLPQVKPSSERQGDQDGVLVPSDPKRTQSNQATLVPTKLTVSAQTEDAPNRRQNKLSDEALTEIYNKILQCYALNKIDVHKAENQHPYVEGPASILFRVKPSAQTDPKKLYDKGSALKVALELEEDQNISFGIDRGFVTIDVPKSEAQRYFVDADEIWSRWKRPSSGLSVPIGEDRYGEIVDLDFSSPSSPHLLVAGTTGSGKSEALNAILFGLTQFYSPTELQLLLIDPKGTELEHFAKSEHLLGDIGWDDADAIELLRIATAEMERRYAVFKSARVRNIVEYKAQLQEHDPLPWWLIVLDEYADLTSDPQSKKTIEQDLKRLAAKARAAGIHLIIATQKPSAEVISTTLRSNLPAQLALKVPKGIESRVVMDESGAENLNGKGDAFLRKGGAPLRIQCAKVDLGAHS